MLSIYLAQLTGLHIFEGRLFRAGAAALLSIFLVMVIMPSYIRFLKSLNATSDFESANDQSPPPILGGLLLIVVSIVCSLIFFKFNTYVISTLVIMALYSAVGAIDDIAKIRNKRLVALGKLSAADFMAKADGISASLRLSLYFLFSLIVAGFAYYFIPELQGFIQVPFIKPSTWYPQIPSWLYIVFMSFIITATANGTNFTDGLDSLVSVPIITTILFAGIVAYISGNMVASHYLNLAYRPGVDELFPLAASIIGSVLANLWFNAPPAEIYMGDAGSIGFGGAIGIMFILIQAELFLPLVGIIIIAEALSVAMQIGYYKMTKKRIFLCAPLHHHYQFKWKEKFANKSMMNSKIVWRMHLVSIFALILTLTIYFKVR